jgi:hypothetical protein
MESSELSSGDIVWFVPNGSVRPVQGEVTKVIDSESIPCIEAITLLECKYRCVALSRVAFTAAEAKKKFKVEQESSE